MGRGKKRAKRAHEEGSTLGALDQHHENQSGGKKEVEIQSDEEDVAMAGHRPEAAVLRQPPAQSVEQRDGVIVQPERGEGLAVGEVKSKKRKKRKKKNQS